MIYEYYMYVILKILNIIKFHIQLLYDFFNDCKIIYHLLKYPSLFKIEVELKLHKRDYIKFQVRVKLTYRTTQVTGGNMFPIKPGVSNELFERTYLNLHACKIRLNSVRAFAIFPRGSDRA